MFLGFILQKWMINLLRHLSKMPSWSAKKGEAVDGADLRANSEPRLHRVHEEVLGFITMT
jgi:hypothetical protein